MISRTILFALLAALPLPAEPGPAPRIVRLDLDGDILPDGAIARMGSRRFRDPRADALFVDEAGKIVSCFERHAVRWWDLESGRYLRGWSGPVDRPTFSQDGRMAAWSTAGGFVVWDTWNDWRLKVFATERKVVGLTFARGGDTVATISEAPPGLRPAIHIWSLRTGQGELLGRLAETPYALFFADGDRVLICQTDELSVFGWNVAAKKVCWQREGAILRHMERTGRRFTLYNARNESMSVVDAATGMPTEDINALPFEDDARPLGELAPDGHTAFCNWRLYDLRHKIAGQTGREIRHQGVPRGQCPAVCFTADSTRLVFFTGHRLHVYDAATAKRLTDRSTAWGPSEEIQRLHWSVDGCSVLLWYRKNVADSPPPIDNWDAHSGKYIGPVTYLAAIEQLKQIRTLGLIAKDAPALGFAVPAPRDAQGRRLREQPGLNYSPDGNLLACGRYLHEPENDEPESRRIIICDRIDHSVPRVPSPTVVERLTGRALVTLDAKGAGPSAFAPDGRSLAVIEPDGVRLYDVLTGKPRLFRSIPRYASGERDEPSAWSVSFSPDGTRLAVIEHGGTVLVVDAASGRNRRPWNSAESELLWSNLGAAEPAIAWAAIFHLLDHPRDAHALLAKRLEPVRVIDNVKALLARLDAANFRTRETATKQLLAAGDAVRADVSAALKSAATSEQRQRLETIVADLGDDLPAQPVDLQRLRSLMILRRLNTPEAAKLIAHVASGMPGARATLAAQVLKVSR